MALGAHALRALLHRDCLHDRRLVLLRLLDNVLSHGRSAGHSIKVVLGLLLLNCGCSDHAACGGIVSVLLVYAWTVRSLLSVCEAATVLLGHVRLIKLMLLLGSCYSSLARRHGLTDTFWAILSV